MSRRRVSGGIQSTSTSIFLSGGPLRKIGRSLCVGNEQLIYEVDHFVKGSLGLYQVCVEMKIGRLRTLVSTVRERDNMHACPPWSHPADFSDKRNSVNREHDDVRNDRIGLVRLYVLQRIFGTCGLA